MHDNCDVLHAAPPGYAIALNPVILEPPSSDEGVHDTVISSLNDDSEVIVGAPGAVAGVTGGTATAAEDPATLLAVTVKL